MNENYKRLYRSRTDRMVSGLSAGLGSYIGLDPTVIRLAFALGSIFLFPMPIIIYFVMMLVVPEEPLVTPPAAPVYPPAPAAPVVSAAPDAPVDPVERVDL